MLPLLPYGRLSMSTLCDVVRAKLHSGRSVLFFLFCMSSVDLLHFFSRSSSDAKLCGMRPVDLAKPQRQVLNVDTTRTSNRCTWERLSNHPVCIGVPRTQHQAVSVLSGSNCERTAGETELTSERRVSNILWYAQLLRAWSTAEYSLRQIRETDHHCKEFSASSPQQKRRRQTCLWQL